MSGGGIREIPLSKGFVALVDDADFDWLSQWKWHVFDNGRGYRYAITKWRPEKGARQQTIYMHRQLLDAPRGLVVDHISGETLDNRRSNLRLCTPTENTRNSRAIALYKGVNRISRHRWMARIVVDGTTHYLGLYVTPEDAARAYDAAARRMYGEFARLNFPESFIVPTRPASRSPGVRLNEDIVRQIRSRAAAGESAVSIAKDIGASRENVRLVVRGLAWRHVLPEAA